MWHADGSGGKERYSHALLSPAVVKPGSHKDLTESIRNLRASGDLDSGKQLYANQFITNHRVEEHSVVLSTLTRYWYFEGWEALMLFMITQLELPDPGS